MIASQPVAGHVLSSLALSGHDVHLHRIGLRAGAGRVDPAAWSEAARALVGELADAAQDDPASDDRPRGVLHALDPGAWVVATTVRRFLDLPLVLRVAEPLPAERTRRRPVLVECLRRADAVGVLSLAVRRDLMRWGVRGDRIQLVPEVGLPFTEPPQEPLLRRRIAVLDYGSRLARERHPLEAAQPFLERAGVRVSVADRRWSPQQRAAAIDAADLVLCGAEADHHALEAMWRGRAVVAPDTPEMAEVITDRHTGRLFRAGDRDELLRVLGRLVDSPFSVQAHGLAARSAAESRYGPAQLAMSYERLYGRAATA
ncbi:hypothetical protein ACIB24_18985 [Spongisporangium articulatum]|uniref:Glycosyltransferase n=1 Tax=Spongisporangium articulatum TaxID=3362603 RepID=A0ABW8ARY5_9ACTN